MAINKKLIHFKKKENFDNEVANNNILDSSIIFILDSKEISTHGTVYKTVCWSTLKPGPITFNIDGITYNGLSGMSWEEWLTSEYNTLEKGYNIRENGNVDVGESYVVEFDNERALITIGTTCMLNTDTIKNDVDYWAKVPTDPILFTLMYPVMEGNGWLALFTGEYAPVTETTQRGFTWGDWATLASHIIGDGCGAISAYIDNDQTIKAEFAPGCLGGLAEGVWVLKDEVNVQASDLITEGDIYYVNPVGYIGGGF